MDKRKGIKQETVDNYFYEEFKSILLKIDINEYPNAANKVIDLLTEAIEYYQNTNSLKNNGVILITPQNEKGVLPKSKEELNKIILSLARELDKGYDVYLLVSEKKEEDEFDESLTLHAGEKIRQAKEILQGIITKIEEEREWMSNPIEDERRRNYR